MFTPFSLKSLHLKNRLVFSPTLTYSAKEGLINHFHHTHYGARSLGGVGLLMTEMCAVSADARITDTCPGIWNDQQANAWKALVNQIHENGAKIGLQLGHAGRRAFNNPVSASALAFDEQSLTPSELTLAQMQTLIDAFKTAAKHAADAGFDCLELQAAHGYLLSGFISPLTNQRQDEYGGSLENRMKFPLAVFEAVKSVWPSDRPVFVRISATDWAEGGTSVDDSIAISRLFKQAGADLIVVSSGEVVSHQKPIYGRMYQTPFSDRIRNEVNIPTMAVGGISEADHCNSIIAAGRADLCALSRPLLANPNWVAHEAARLHGDQIDWAPQYAWGQTWFLQNERKKGI